MQHIITSDNGCLILIFALFLAERPKLTILIKESISLISAFWELSILKLGKLSKWTLLVELESHDKFW